MDKINFSTNWNNKLMGKAFTTIRIHNPFKYVIGKQYLIELNGKRMGNALLKEKRTLSIAQLNEFICYIDTGYSKAETIRILRNMYPDIDFSNTLFDFCLLIYSEPKKVHQRSTQIEMRLPYKD